MITYPIDCISPRQRHQFVLRMQEVLRLVHNRFGKWRKDGITAKADYDAIIAAMSHIVKTSETPLEDESTINTTLKIKYPYVVQLSEETWQKFKNEDFKARNAILSGEIVERRNEIKAETQWSKEINI